MRSPLALSLFYPLLSLLLLVGEWSPCLAYWTPPPEVKFQIILSSALQQSRSGKAKREAAVAGDSATTPGWSPQANATRSARRYSSRPFLPSRIRSRADEAPAAAAATGTTASDADFSITDELSRSGISVFDIDLFTNSAGAIARLHEQGIKVICYFSAGSYEPFRLDSGRFRHRDMGNNLQQWPEEQWLDLDSQHVRDLMIERLDMAAQKGCDAVDPDNMDGYTFTDNGLGLSEASTVRFVRFLSTEAHARGLAIGLKNAMGLLDQVAADIDFAVNEECASFGECGRYAPLVAQGKAVLHIEYPTGAPAVPEDEVAGACAFARGESGAGFNTILKKYNLDGWAAYCDGSEIEV